MWKDLGMGRPGTEVGGLVAAGQMRQVKKVNVYLVRRVVLVWRVRGLDA